MEDEGEFERKIKEMGFEAEKSGFSFCFGTKESRDKYYDELMKRIEESRKTIPSDVEVAKGVSPHIEKIPYPFVINIRWEYAGDEREGAWDKWLVEHTKDLPIPEDIYYGIPRVREFNEEFLNIQVNAIKKLKDMGI